MMLPNVDFVEYVLRGEDRGELSLEELLEAASMCDVTQRLSSR